MIQDLDNMGVKALLAEMLMQTITDLAFELRHNRPGEAHAMVREGGVQKNCLMCHSGSFLPDVPWVIERAIKRALRHVPTPVYLVNSFREIKPGKAAAKHRERSRLARERKKSQQAVS